MTTVALKRRAEVIAGQSPSSADVHDLSPGMSPFLQGNAEFGSLNPSPKHACDVAPKRARVDDILLSVRAPVGALNVADRNYGIGRGLCAIRPRPDTDGRFLWWALHSSVGALTSVATGSTYTAVTADDVGSLQIPDRTLAEQRAIADYLDAETARIDALIAKKQQLIHLLEERWQSVVSNRVWGATHGRTRLKYLAGLPTSGNRDHGSFTDNDSGVPCLRGLNVRPARLDLANLRFISEEDHARQFQTQLHVGDLVIVRSGLAGAAVRIPHDLQPCNCVDLVVVRRSALLDPRFTEYVINSREAQQQVAQNSAGALLTHFNAIDAGNLSIPELPIARQEEIVDALDREQERQRSLVTSLAVQMELLIEHRRGLVTAAFTGELQVHVIKQED